jgi:hypothetical protein
MKLFASSRVREPEKHKYVRLIEFAMVNPSFSAEAACKACDLSRKEFQFISTSVFVLSAYQESEGSTRTTQVQEWILRPEAYFGYLQFVEFQHAIETAKRAYWLSVLAVVVALISAALAIRYA